MAEPTDEQVDQAFACETKYDAYRLGWRDAMASQDDSTELTTGHCPFCNRVTQQKITGIHERDSSNERTECLECRAFQRAGEWRAV